MHRCNSGKLAPLVLTWFVFGCAHSMHQAIPSSLPTKVEQCTMQSESITGDVVTAKAEIPAHSAVTLQPSVQVRGERGGSRSLEYGLWTNCSFRQPCYLYQFNLDVVVGNLIGPRQDSEGNTHYQVSVELRPPGSSRARIRAKLIVGYECSPDPSRIPGI